MCPLLRLFDVDYNLGCYICATSAEVLNNDRFEFLGVRRSHVVASALLRLFDLDFKLDCSVCTIGAKGLGDNRL